MPYSIKPSDDGRYIVVTTQGNLTNEIALRQNIESHALGKKLSISRYLVDVTQARNIDSVPTNYKFAYEDMVAAPEIDKNARIALVADPQDHSHDFIETAFRNAGFHIRLFRNRDEAIRHLLL